MIRKVWSDQPWRSFNEWSDSLTRADVARNILYYARTKCLSRTPHTCASRASRLSKASRAAVATAGGKSCSSCSHRRLDGQRFWHSASCTEPGEATLVCERTHE
eukprot:177140-Pleurochrysis_carterae.AAC.4